LKKLIIEPESIFLKRRRNRMELSFPEIKTMVQDCKDAQYGQYVNLELLLSRLVQERKEMDGAEAVLRFLYELSKI